MAWAVLKITDGTKANAVNLLSRKTGWHLMGWRPTIAQYKEGGVWIDNAMAHGRKLSMRRFANATESMGVILVGNDFDSAMADLRKLRGLFEKAADYWEQAYNNTPIYVEARSANETNSRYAVIYAGSVAEDADVIDPTFASKFIAAGLPVAFEHAPWQDVVPGSSTCVQVSSQSSVYLPVSISASPVASLDDVCATTINFYDLAANTFGDIGGDSFSSAVRFASVAIPKNAIITRAYIELYAEGAGATTVCNANIDGEDADNALIFSDIVDYAARTRTTAAVPWAAIGAWVDGVQYNTPDIKTVIQEIVNRAGWVSGNHLVIFIDDNVSDNDAHRHYTSVTGTHTPAKLVVEYRGTIATLIGRAATCLNEVYIANKHTETSVLTNVYHYDASVGSYSGNLLGVAFPFNLLPSPAEDDDALYIGVAYTAGVGPVAFNSVVFDIGSAAAYGGAATVTFQYYHTDTTWHALTAITSNLATDSVLITRPFTVTGVQSIHFVQPTDWLHVSINGIDAMWIRMLCNIGGGDSITVPTQQNRAIYTGVLPYISIAASQITGDINASLEILMHNMSSYFAAWPATPYINSSQRVLMAARSLSRGSSFTPFIYPKNGSVQLYIAPTISTYVSNSGYPQGWAVDWVTVGATAMTVVAYAGISAAMLAQYLGKFRVYALTNVATTTFNMRLSIAIDVGGTFHSLYDSDEIAVSTHSNGITDLGEIELSAGGPLIPLGNMYILIYASSVGAGTLDIIGLKLMPVDEYIADVIESADRNSALYQDFTLYMDNIIIPKYAGIRAYVIPSTYYGGVATISWQAIGKSLELKPLLSTDAYRLWFLSMYAYNTSSINDWCYDVSSCDRVRVYKVQHYLSCRGAG